MSFPIPYFDPAGRIMTTARLPLAGTAGWRSGISIRLLCVLHVKSGLGQVASDRPDGLAMSLALP
ncbi:MAG: hypothetical protein HY316_01135 [Acidobacteria bacterium]|nr:hypothetical protein [Acidobacteriota bacterium]